MTLLTLVLPATGSDPAHAFLAAIAPHPSAYTRLLLHPPGTIPPPGLPARPVPPAALPGPAAWRHRRGLYRLLRRLHPAIVEIHDDPALAGWLGERLRPIPVLLVLHRPPAPWPDPAARTRLLAQVTRAASPDPAIRTRLLDGVHRAMAHCTLLPQDPAAAAAMLDTLRQDALRAWSQPLGGPI